MLDLHFQGWFQCRLSTDPDPANEPRGVSGWTFAVGDEPDLDRIIRFQLGPQDPPARVPGPVIGVHVNQVVVDGQTDPSHALHQASVELIDDPKFVGRNGILFEDEEEPIDPFHIRFRSSDGSVVVSRKDVLDGVPEGLEAIYDAGQGVMREETPRPSVQRRLPVLSEAFSARAADATGVFDYAAHRSARRTELLNLADTLTDPGERAAVHKRIRELSLTGRRLGFREIALGLRLSYEFGIQGPSMVEDPCGRLQGKLAQSEAVPWLVEMWVGAFDADALCAYTQGVVSIPFFADK